MQSFPNIITVSLTTEETSETVSYTHLSDELLLTAQGLETIERKDENKLRKTCARIEEIIKEYGVEEIVQMCIRDSYIIPHLGIQGINY